MEEENVNKKSPVTLREIITDRAIASFFGLYMVYLWMGTENSKVDIVAAFGIKFFAILKAVILMASMLCGVLGGRKLFKILYKLKRSVKFIDTDDDEK
jgi:hypothetical protein